MPAGELEAHPGGVRDVEFHPNSTQAATAGADGLVRLWQLPVAAARDTTPHAVPIRGLSVSSDATLVATASDDKTVKIVQLSDGKELKTLAGHEAQVWDAAISATRRKS